MRIAYLGPPGTFSEEAARVASTLLDADVIPFASMPALVSAAETRLAECAILPIENSLEGAVSSTTDLLIHETELRIRAELVLPVRHFLLAAGGAELASIRAVTSHPQALGQCRRFLDRCLPGVEQVAALSTAAAVEAVSQRDDGSLAAIGTMRAAELYGVDVLAQDIQDYRNNVTRFVVLAERDAPPTGHDKTSLCFGVRANVPGALYQVLAVLATADIQMTKVESRPKKSKLGDYYFLVDIDGHRDNPAVARALAELDEIADGLKIFGSYPAWDDPAGSETA